MYAFNNQVHAHNTRQAEKLHVISHNTIYIYGAKLWNDLGLDLTNCPTLASFKRKYKAFLISS